MLKIVSSIAGIGVVSSTVAIPVVQYVNNLGDKKLIFNNRQYNSYDEAAADYLNFIGGNISRNQYYGDINDATINHEMGIVDGSKLTEYDPSNTSPAYLTASGNLTPSIDVARNSYANMGNARTWYSDGITDIPRYSYDDALSYGRSSIMKPVYSLVDLQLPKGVNGIEDRNITINPTNKDDIDMVSERINNSDLLSNLINARLSRGDNQDEHSNEEKEYDGWTIDFAIDRRSMSESNSVYGDTLLDNSIVEISHDTATDLLASTTQDIARFYDESAIDIDFKQKIDEGKTEFKFGDLSGVHEFFEYDINTNKILLKSSNSSFDKGSYVKIADTYSNSGSQSDYDNHDFNMGISLTRGTATGEKSLIYDTFDKVGSNPNNDEIGDGVFGTNDSNNLPIDVKDFSEVIQINNVNTNVNFSFAINRNGGSRGDEEIDMTISDVNINQSWSDDYVHGEINLSELHNSKINMLTTQDLLDPLGGVNSDIPSLKLDYSNIKLNGRFYDWKKWSFGSLWTYYHQMQIQSIDDISTTFIYDNSSSINPNNYPSKLFNTRLSEANYRYEDDLKMIIKYHDSPIYITTFDEDRELENISKYNFGNEGNILTNNNIFDQLVERGMEISWLQQITEVLKIISEAKDFTSNNQDLVNSLEELHKLLGRNTIFNQLSISALQEINGNTGNLSESYLQYLNNLSQYWGIFYSGKTTDFFSTDKALYDFELIKHIFSSPEQLLEIEVGKIEWYQHVAYDRTIMNRHFVDNHNQIYKPISNNRIVSIEDLNRETFLEDDLDFFLPKPMLFWVIYSVDGQELVSSSSKLDNSKFDVIELIIDNLNRLNPVKFASKYVYYNSGNGEQDVLINGTINNIYELNHRGNQVFFKEYNDIKTYIIEYIKENSIWK